MNRRDALGAIGILPAAILTTVAAGYGVTGQRTALRSLFLDWQKAKTDFNSYPHDSDTPEGAALIARILEIEDCAATLEPETVEDFALKVIFADDDGLMFETKFQAGLVMMAYRIAEVEPETQLWRAAAKWTGHSDEAAS